MRRFIGDKPRAIANDTYKHFAKKYKIRLTAGGKPKPYGKLAQQIYNHENRTGVAKGLYFTPK
jgi:hypothetical protein